MNNQHHLIFSDIINGYSSATHSSFGEVFIKHLSYIEVGYIDNKYNFFFDDAMKSGLQSYKDREKYILGEGFWTERDDLELISQQKYIQDLKINISKDYLYSRRKQLRKDVLDAENKLESLKIKKEFYIDKTAEQFANRKLINVKITSSFFKDLDFKEKLIDDYMNDENYYELMNLYSKYKERLDSNSLKKISISPFFTNIFYLCEDNIYSFFGKPVLKLTNHQTDLFAYARYFKHVISESQRHIPKDVMGDPDELMEWLELTTNAKEAGLLADEDSFGDGDGGGGSIVGATKEDMEKLGLDTSRGSHLSEALKKKGTGQLDMEDLYKLRSL